MMIPARRCLLVLLLLAGPLRGEPADVATFAAHDTLAVRPDPSPDAQAMLDHLAWEPGPFAVTCAPDERWGSDALVRFDSPQPVGDEANDRVALAWYAARDQAGQVRHAPAILVIHESASAMTVGRIIAAALARHDVHAFLLHLPGYGERRTARRDDPTLLSARLRQGIADARRARDAIAALPHIDDRHIAVQGTSLGGFVAGNSAAIDDAFDSAWVTLAGGRLDVVLTEGRRDAAAIVRRLEAAGLDRAQILDLFHQVEPTRVAHRISPDRLFVIRAVADTVIPRAASEALAEAAAIPEDHRIVIPGDHYTAAIALPAMIEHIASVVRTRAAQAAASPE